MTVGIVMTVLNIKTAHRRNLLGTVITMPTVITLSPTLGVTQVVWIMALQFNAWPDLVGWVQGILAQGGEAI